MNGEIIAVGSELLLGQIANTNAQFLSQQLAKIGINVYYHTVVGDNAERLKNAIKIAEQRSNLIIFTGGLGPTKDDLTKETIASHLGLRLIMDEPSLQAIEHYFQKANRPMTENNRKQALVLEGSEILPNKAGMAPGMVITKQSITYMLLPGPPREMEPMFIHYGKNALLKRMKNKESIESRVLRFFGIGEAKLESELEDLFETQTNPTLAPLASEGEVTIRLTAKHPIENERKNMLDSLEQKILARIGQFFYGYNDTSLIKELGNLVKRKGLTLAVAESLTGGLFQEEITAIPGASTWFKGGVVTYRTETKMNLLHVNKETVEKFGVVSSDCAKEMAENVRQLFAADIGISFTGVAGPQSLEGKEPGTVFIGWSIKGQEPTAQYVHLQGNRDTIRYRSIKHGAWKLFQALRS